MPKASLGNFGAAYFGSLDIPTLGQNPVASYEMDPNYANPDDIGKLSTSDSLSFQKIGK